MENNKSSILAQFFAGSFGGVILGIVGLIALTNIDLFGPALPFISVVFGVISGIVIANKTAMTRQARVIPWLGIGFFILPPVLLTGSIGRLTPKVSDPMEIYFMFLFMVGIMATSIVLSAIAIGAIKWQKTLISHKFLVFGIILLACSLIVYIFFPDLYWTLPALSGAGVFALVAPLARLSQTNAWWRKYSLLVGGMGFVSLWLYGLIVLPPVRWPYAHLVVGIIFIVLWIFRRKKFVLNLTNNSMDNNQKNSLYVISAVVAVILLAGLGYFGFAKKSTPAAQPATPPAAQQPEEPFTYTKNDKLFNVTKKEFSVADQFSASTLKDQSKECGTNKTEQYYKDLLSKYTGSDKGAEYRFQYQGPTQDSGAWVVTVIPNKLGYANIGDFEKDFDACYGGGDRYPSLVSDKYLLFTSSCGTGFDDDSGKPHGCDLVSDVVAPSIVLQSDKQRSEAPFVFTGKRPTGSNADLYKGYVIIEGKYEKYAESGPYGNGPLFFADTQYQNKLPEKYDEHSSVFIFDNPSEANQAFGISPTVFSDKAICKVSGRAMIAIEDYAVELLESSVMDHTKLVTVLSATDQTKEACPER